MLLVMSKICTRATVKELALITKRFRHPCCGSTAYWIGKIVKGRHSITNTLNHLPGS